jgi:hypothetical protein
MNKTFLTTSFFVAFSLCFTLSLQAQHGSFKFCPGTPAWNANKSMVENEREMYDEYAKHQDGCWYMKTVKHASYKKGYYTFDFEGRKKLYYDSKKKLWYNEARNACVNDPFGN